jgi:hypothetical protein
MRQRLAIAAALALSLAATAATGEPLRLRGDALATAESPAGLMTLEASGQARSWLSAEALVWLGARPDTDGNALVIALVARDPSRRAQARAGRFVAAAGALRPTHIDGLSARAALPWWQLHAEAFGGAPVLAGEGGRAYSWITGGRISRSLGRWGSTGVGYMQRREAGRLADEELAFDAGGAATSRLDLGFRGAYDLSSPGISEVRGLAAWRWRAYRFGAFATHRSPSRLLPATSLFSVLGDVPSQRLGGEMTWRAAPRLDVVGVAAASYVAEELGADLEVRGLLRLDPRGRGLATLGVRRQNAPLADFTGIRATGRVPAGEALWLSTELELAIPDDPRDRGRAWPWGLVALRWTPQPLWQAAVGLEASSTPTHRFRTDALLRVSRAWEAP